VVHVLPVVQVGRSMKTFINLSTVTIVSFEVFFACNRQRRYYTVRKQLSQLRYLNENGFRTAKAAK
jgi:hypothetical protein